MSTKTSIKRVALVAVSALGFGLLSVVPAKAAQATTSAITGVTITGSAGNSFGVGTAQTFTAAFSGSSFSAEDAITLKAYVSSQPGTGAITIDATAGAKIAGTAVSLTGGLARSSDTVTLTSATHGISTGTFMKIDATTAAADVLTADGVSVTAATTGTLTYTTSTSGTISAENASVQILSSVTATDATIGAITHQMPASASAFKLANGTYTAGTFAFTPPAAGSYTLTVFHDENGDGAVTSGEDSTSTTFNAFTGGTTNATDAVTSVTLTSNQTSVVAGNHSAIVLSAEDAPATASNGIEIVVEVASAPTAAIANWSNLTETDSGFALTSNDYVSDAANTGGTITITANTLLIPGTYTFRAYSDTDEDRVYDSGEQIATVSVQVLPVNFTGTGTATLTLSNNAAAYRSAKQDISILGTRPTSGVGSTGTQNWVAVVTQSPDADLPVGTVLEIADGGSNGSTLTGGSANLATVYTSASTINTLTLEGGSADLVTSVGTYSIFGFVDADGDLTYDSGEAWGTTSFVIGSTPAALSASITPSSLTGTDGVNVATITFTVTDSVGRATTLDSETIAITEDTAASLTYGEADGILDSSGEQVTNLAGQATNQYATTITGIAALTADTTFTGTLSTDSTVTATAVIGKVTTANATEVFYTANAGIKTGTSIKLNSSNATDTMTVDTAVTTVYFSGTVAAADAGKYVEVRVVPNSTSPVSALSRSGLSSIKSNADGTFVFSVAYTSPASSRGYTVTVEAGATDFAYTVSYAAVAPQMVLSPVASGGTVKAKYGDTLNMVATLTDQWLRPLADKTITITIPSTSRNPQTVNKTTDAAGKVTFTLTDAYGASAVKTSDVITFTYSYLATAASTAATNLQKSATVTYTATGPEVGSVAVTSATADVTIDQVEEVSGTPVGSTVVFTATVKDANGVAAGSGILVTFTGGADDKFLDGVNVGVTDANGVATATVYRQKTGFASISASAGGKSGSALPVKWVNTAAHARNVAVVVEPATIVSEGTATVKATVTDRWGNGVAGVTVTFSETGAGRISATTATTNSAGVAQIDFTSAKNETGSNTISAVISGAQSANLAGFVGTTAVAGVTAGNTTATAAVTVTADTAVSTADALLELAKAIGTGKEVEAAADAAAEAIDAANAATDAANLAAEAADAATVAAEEARDAADAATAAVEELATQVATLMSALKAQLTTLANTVAKIAKKVKA